MKTITTIAIVAGVGVAGFLAFRAFKSRGVYGAPEAPVPVSHWDGSGWQSGPAAPGSIPPEGAKPAPISPTNALLLMPADWASVTTQFTSSRTAPPIGTVGLTSSELIPPNPQFQFRSA
jgi:hypothetical protein